MKKRYKKYLPLSESTYYIMLTLVEPLHGYGVMQKVQEISQGTVTIGPGTLYGAFSTLEKEKLIVMVREGRTPKGLYPDGKRAADTGGADQAHGDDDRQRTGSKGKLDTSDTRLKMNKETKMNTVRKFKLFWAWQDEQEEEWLREMSRQGYAYAARDFPGFL